MTKYEPVIGLEVHVQLLTKSKLFCGCPTEFGAEPNRHACPVCLGWPGSLPVLNEKALRLAIKVGLALHCEISPRVKFDRKNYFYPDLPKAYQISQYDMPINKKGWIMIEMKEPKGSVREEKIGITRAHLEEDAGKLLHEGIRDGSLVDYNRAGTPLLEIVSEPDIHSPEAAYEYLVTLKAILQYLEVSDCNMEEGSLRCDANVSVRKKGETRLGTKVEIKNLNSFRAVEKALQYEIERQADVIENHQKVVQETRLWSEAKGQTFSMRSKEEAHDYRYFPEPDLVPFTISEKAVEEIRKTLPELPRERGRRFMKDFQLSPYAASVLVQEKPMADYFEKCLEINVHDNVRAEPVVYAATTSNWIQSELAGRLYQRNLSIAESPVQPEDLAKLIRLIEKNTVSGKIAKDVLEEMFESGKSADDIVKEKGWVQVSDTKLIEEVTERVIDANPKVLEDYRAGKKQALGFLVGQIMKETKGKANPKVVNEILVQKLK